MSRQSFYRFLLSNADRNDAIGEVATDLIADLRIGCLTSRVAGNMRRHTHGEHPAGDLAVLDVLDTAITEWKGLK